jgi:hypothetical protein
MEAKILTFENTLNGRGAQVHLLCPQNRAIKYVLSLQLKDWTRNRGVSLTALSAIWRIGSRSEAFNQPHRRQFREASTYS